MFSPLCNVASANVTQIPDRDTQDAWIMRGRPSVKHHASYFEGEESYTRPVFGVRNITVRARHWGLTCSSRV